MPQYGELSVCAPDLTVLQNDELSMHVLELTILQYDELSRELQNSPCRSMVNCLCVTDPTVS